MSTFVYPRAEEQLELAALIAVGAGWEDPVVDLFINDVVPGINSVLADFDVPSNVEYPGYAQSSAVTWTATPVNLPNGHSAKLGSQKNFIATADLPAPLQVFGYILTGTAGYYQFVRFEEPRTVEFAGDYVVVDPYLLIGNQTVVPVGGE